MKTDGVTIKAALRCVCPRCREGHLYTSRYSMTLREACPECGLDLSGGDAADGPAVFLIFILGGALVPLALWLEFAASPPLWVHAAVWGALAIGVTVGSLRPVKAYVIALQYKHRPEMFE